jgi:hypothetical protein
MFRETVTIEWNEEITEKVPVDPPATGHRVRRLGISRKRCKVMVQLDTAAVANHFGPRACKSKGGLAREANGLLKVYRLNEPVTVTTTLRPVSEAV